jgi:hypothetical protein
MWRERRKEETYLKSLGAEIMLRSIFDLFLSEGLLSFFLEPKKLKPPDDALEALLADVSARLKDGEPAVVVAVEARAEAAGEGAIIDGRIDADPWEAGIANVDAWIVLLEGTFEEGWGGWGGGGTKDEAAEEGAEVFLIWTGGEGLEANGGGALADWFKVKFLRFWTESAKVEASSSSANEKPTMHLSESDGKQWKKGLSTKYLKLSLPCPCPKLEDQTVRLSCVYMFIFEKCTREKDRKKRERERERDRERYKDICI